MPRERLDIDAMANDAEMLLDIAERSGGFVTTATAAAALSGATAADIRRTLSALCRAGALLPVMAHGIPGVLYLTTRGRGCGTATHLTPAQRREISSRTVAPGRARPAKLRIQPRTTTIHNLVAAHWALRLGETATLPGELPAQRGKSVPDAIAHLATGERILIEVERMVNQGVRRWRRRGGLVAKILAPCYGAAPSPKTWLLAVTPQRIGSVPDAEAWLQAELMADERRSYHAAPEPGWWWADLDAPSQPPRWHSLADLWRPAPVALE